MFCWPGVVPCVLPPLDDPPPVDQVEDEEEEGEEAEEGHVGPREPLGAGSGAAGHTLWGTESDMAGGVVVFGSPLGDYD